MNTDMTVQAANTSKARGSKSKAESISPIEAQAAKRSAIAERVNTWAQADSALTSEHAATRMNLLVELVKTFGRIDQNDWKTWLKEFFEKARPEENKANRSARAPVVVALSQGFEPNAGEGFDAYRPRALAWLKTQPDTIYKVQEKAARNPAPAGESDAPEGKESGRAGAGHSKVRTWDRDEVLKWLSGGDSDALWALDTVLTYSRDNAFLDALQKIEEQAEARAKPRARRPSKA
jgi:hypothetical protein